MKNLAAYISQGSIFIARFGNWGWLYNDKPKGASWIRNDNGGKRVTWDQIDRAISRRTRDLVHSYFFSDQRLSEEIGRIGL